VKLIDLRKKSYFGFQNLISKYMNTTNLYKQIKDLIGEIYTAEVHHVRPRVVILVDDEGMKLFSQRETNTI
jgi:N utilization substance protein A